MADGVVKLAWTCGLAVGATYWQTVDIYESDECGCEFETEHEIEEVEERIASAICPKCGGELNMRDDAPDIIPITGK